MDYRFLLVFCACLFSCFESKAEGSLEAENDEKAFYIASTLRYHIEQIIEPEDGAIEFDNGTIATLWSGLQEHLPDKGKVFSIQQLYYQTKYEAGQEELSSHLSSVAAGIIEIWNDLRSPLVKGFYDLWQEKELYPNISNNPNVTAATRKIIKPYLMPLDHPAYSLMEDIFSKSRISRNEGTFEGAGFVFLDVSSTSYIRVAKHPSFPGYLFKVYLDDSQVRDGKEGCYWLAKRCQGAEYIRALIKQKKITRFSVPDKCLYPFPAEEKSVWASGISPQACILVVTEMNIVDIAASDHAWKTKITKQHLDELYMILSHGFGTTYLGINVPYTTDGRFAFIDTEFPKRKLNYHKVKQYLSHEMASYWDKLIKRGGL